MPKSISCEVKTQMLCVAGAVPLISPQKYTVSKFYVIRVQIALKKNIFYDSQKLSASLSSQRAADSRDVVRDLVMTAATVCVEMSAAP